MNEEVMTSLREGLVSSIKGYVSRQVDDLSTRLKALEEREAIVPLVYPSVADLVAEVLKQLPVPVNGKDGENGKDGQNGRDAELDVDTLVKTIAAGIPVPRDGTDGVDGQPGRDGENGKDGVVGPDGPAGKDGGPGDDGRDGKDGRDGISGLHGRDGEKGLDGINGKDGVDGFGLEDFEFDLKEDGRTLVMKFVRGDVVKEKELRLPIVLDAGVYSSEKQYMAGDGVTFGGSFFIAQKDAPGKPEAGDGWRLAVKRGRDGKDGGVVLHKQQERVRV